MLGLERLSTTPSTTTSGSSSRGCARRIGCCASDGTLYLHLDYREVALLQGALDEIFGRDVLPERDRLGLRLRRARQRRWPAKHDTILVYVKDPQRVLLRRRGGRSRAVHGARASSAPRRRRAGSFRPTSGGTRSSRRRAREDRLPDAEARSASFAGSCAASSRPGDWCLDFFAGSGTLGAAALELGRRSVLCDASPEAVRGDARAARAAGLHDRRRAGAPESRHGEPWTLSSLRRRPAALP